LQPITPTAPNTELGVSPAAISESDRLKALERYEILDTISEAEFEDITWLASHLCGAPIALISLVDSKRQWFKSAYGLAATESPREFAICDHAIRGQGVFEVPNTLRDERFKDNPFVTGDTGVRFYAGAPLQTPDGQNIGTICVIDRTPRELTDEQREALTRLSRQVILLMESRLTQIKLEKQGRDQRKESLEKDRWAATLLSNLSGMVFRASGTDTTRIEFASEGSRSLLGFEPDELTSGKVNYQDLIHPDDREKVLARYAAKIRDRKPIEIEYRLLLPGKRIKWVWVRAECVFSPEGSFEAVEGFITDITERKEAERIYSEQAALIDKAHDAIFVRDLEGRFLFWNPGAERLYGWSSAEAVGRRCQELLQPKPEKFDEAIRIILRKGEWTGELEQWTKDRRLVVCKCSWTLLFDAKGNPERILVINTDITQLKRSIEKHVEQAALIDQSRDAILVYDLDCRVIFWNKGAEDLYGWSNAEVTGKKLTDLFCLDASHFTEAHGEAMRVGTWNGEQEQRNRNGEKVIADCRWTLLRGDEGEPKAVMVVNTDITERKKMEANFLRAERMESIGTLAGGIAHDLNNLLSPIMIGTDLLKHFGLNGPSLKVVEDIERSTKRGASLVRQVLSFARGEEGARVSVHVGDVINEIGSITKSTFPKNITLSTSTAGDIWLISSDPTQLTQILLNLCVNARDALPQGGHISVNATNIIVDNQYASMLQRKTPPGRYVCIEVTDTGTGIPKDKIDRIFEPFFTTKELGQGTGLGLATVLGIIRSHGGFINVYSEVGMGTTFRVLLPAEASSTGGPIESDEDNDRPRGQGEWILIVDDETSILRITQRTLEAYGYQVITAEDGAQAVKLFHHQQEKIAVVLTDMMMPVMDGPSMIAELKRIQPALPVIASSGLNADEHVARATDLGVKHFLTKPYTTGLLLQTLRSVLSKNSV
jgi:two-component system cell cycle sensor histidine kinase/response regulator CckA